MIDTQEAVHKEKHVFVGGVEIGDKPLVIGNDMEVDGKIIVNSVADIGTMVTDTLSAGAVLQPDHVYQVSKNDQTPTSTTALKFKGKISNFICDQEAKVVSYPLGAQGQEGDDVLTNYEIGPCAVVLIYDHAVDAPYGKELYYKQYGNTIDGQPALVCSFDFKANNFYTFQSGKDYKITETKFEPIFTEEQYEALLSLI